MEVEKFKEWVTLRECSIDFSDARTLIAFKDSYKTTEVYIKHLKPYLDPETWEYLIYNLLLHQYIVSGIDKSLYDKFDIDGKTMIISSASNSSSSTSIQGFKSLEEGKFMLMDLWRTPYGRQAYNVLESLQGLAIVLL